MRFLFENRCVFQCCLFDACCQHFVDFGVIFGGSGRSKIALKSFPKRFVKNRKNLLKRGRVASKSRFASPEVAPKMTLRSKLRPEKSTCNADQQKTQIFSGFGIHLGSIWGSKIDAKSYQKLSRKSTIQKIASWRLPGAMKSSE